MKLRLSRTGQAGLGGAVQCCLQAMSFAWLRFYACVIQGVLTCAPRLLRGVSRAALHGALLLANCVFRAPRRGACAALCSACLQAMFSALLVFYACVVGGVACAPCLLRGVSRAALHEALLRVAPLTRREAGLGGAVLVYRPCSPRCYFIPVPCRALPPARRAFCGT